MIQEVVGLGEISGFKFNDTNRNGQFDSDETGVADATIFIDANANGVVDANEFNAIVLTQREDVNIDASGRLKVTATREAFVGSNEPLRIDTIIASDIRVRAAGNVTNARDVFTAASAAETVNLSAGSLVVEAGGGDIGAADRPLVIDLATNSDPLVARAAGDVYLYETSGDLPLSSVVAGGRVHLSAPGQIVVDKNDIFDTGGALVAAFSNVVAPAVFFASGGVASASMLCSSISPESG